MNAILKPQFTLAWPYVPPRAHTAFSLTTAVWQ